RAQNDLRKRRPHVDDRLHGRHVDRHLTMGAFRIQEADRPHMVRLLIVWVILSAIGIVGVLQINYPPYDQSIQGQDQASTLKLLTALATPVFIAVVMMVVYSAIYFRRTTKELVDGPPMLGNTPVQIAWVAI